MCLSSHYFISTLFRFKVCEIKWIVSIELELRLIQYFFVAIIVNDICL